MFEEYQQPAIQTDIVPCPQSSDHGLDTVFRNPNKNTVEDGPQHWEKKDDKIRETDKITACRYTNRDPNKQEVGFIFVWI
jgi:hypothetical protein